MRKIRQGEVREREREGEGGRRKEGGRERRIKFKEEQEMILCNIGMKPQELLA